MSFTFPSSLQHRKAGFTIVELLIVIVVIAILAAITIVAYRGVQQRAITSMMSSDLSGAARAFELYKVDNGNYPTDMPAGVKTSNGVILSATNTTDGSFCLNAYYPNDPSLQISWDSKKGGLQTGSLCSGAAIGGSTGGSVPLAARGTNLMPDFPLWTLTGSAAYNSATKELTLGASGVARSPLVRVDRPLGIKVGGDMYATTASPHVSLAPQGGYLTGINYFGSDGTTPAQNSGGYTSNGCARGIALNTWVVAEKSCSYSGGPGVIYIMFTFTGSNGGYTSPDLKIKTPLLIVND